MVIEYANPQDDTQAILQPMVLTLLMMVARQYKLSIPVPKNEKLSDKIVRYMSEHSDIVTLKDISKHSSGAEDGACGFPAERNQSFC